MYASRFDLVLFFSFYCALNAIVLHEGNSNQPLALQSMSSINQELKIADNPTLIVNNKQPVTLVCKFRASRDAILREVVWYREFDDGTNVKILTYDAMMNITQVNYLAEHNVKGFSPTSIQIDAASPSDDGWYQCHVGIYIDKKIVEKTGYIYLNVLVPPTGVEIMVHDSIEKNDLFKHNFSLVCRVAQSKPAVDLSFTRNGIKITETKHENATQFLNSVLAENENLMKSKGAVENMKSTLKTGTMVVPVDWRNPKGRKVSIKYTILHISALLQGTRVHESASYLLWTLNPDYDTNAEYGCLAQHETLDEVESTKKILRPPSPQWLEIVVKPEEPAIGENVIFQLKSDLANNLYPKPVLLWTTSEGAISEGRKFYVGNKLLIRNIRRNNTVFKVKAFNALGAAEASIQLSLRERSLTDQSGRGSGASALKSSNRRFIFLEILLLIFLIIYKM